MNKKNKDMWFNTYIYLLLPLCVGINIYSLVKCFSNFNYLNNMVITITQLGLIIIAIVLYTLTFYYAKNRLKWAYVLIVISIIYSIVNASFNQVINTFYDQGTKTYLMFLLYLLLFSLCYGIPSYIYFSKRKVMLIKKNMISKEELKEIINKNKRYKK